MTARDPNLAAVADRFLHGQRLTFADGVALYTTPDEEAVRELALSARRARHGLAAHVVANRHLNYSNVCGAACRICAYRRTADDPEARRMSLVELFDEADRAVAGGALELHVVGSIDPALPYRFYVDLVAGLRARCPSVTLKAFTAVEVDHIARRAGRSAGEVLDDLLRAGLSAMPGGGAEIFASRARNLICPGKIAAETWLGIHREAHLRSIPSTCTMLHGHVETVEERVDHLLRLRSLQDETGGFLAYVPLAFHPARTELAGLDPPGPRSHLREIAVGRLLLDNVPHIKSYWITSGLDAAVEALGWGADDLDGTVGHEQIHHAAGSRTPGGVTLEELASRIRDAGFVPRLRDGLHRPLRDL